MNLLSRFFVSVFAALSLCAGAHALPGSVAYSPGVKIMQGHQPFLAAGSVNVLDPQNPYYLVITSPTGISYPQTIQIAVESLDSSPAGAGLGRPAQVSASTAAGFVTTSFVGFTQSADGQPVEVLPTVGGATFTATQVTFTAPLQKAVVLVSVNVPLYDPSGTPLDYVGDYWWGIKSTGWTGGAANGGASINATVLEPLDPEEPKIVPEITNLLPANGTHFSYDPAVGPVSFDINFDINVAAGGDGLEVVTVKINGQPRGTWTAAVGQTTFHGTVSSGNITVAGDYVIEVTATNRDGTDKETSTIVVDVDAPPPAVTIAFPQPNSDYNLFLPAPTVNVPVQFTAKVPDGSGTVVSNVTAKLNGTSRSVSLLAGESLNTPKVDGSVQLDLTTGGHYTLEITAFNEFDASGTTSTDFWINRVVNPADRELTVKESTGAFPFKVEVSGRPNGTNGESAYAYQWLRKDLSELPTGGRYSGINTPTLHISDATFQMSGEEYVCKITTPSGFFYSGSAKLTVKKIVPLLTWSNPADIGYGTHLSSTQLNATVDAASASLGALVYSPADGTKLNAGSNQNLTVTFVPIASEADNYESPSKTVKINVIPAQLTYAANSLTAPYGGPFLLLSGSISGFVDGEQQSDVTTGTMVFTANATPTSPVGSYAINGSGLVANHGNYTFTQAPGNATALTIVKRTLTVTANSFTHALGTPLPAFTATIDGFANGETAVPPVVNGAPAFSTSPALPVPLVAGVYSIIPAIGTLNSGNYAFTFANGQLTVTGEAPACGVALVNRAASMNGQALIRGSLKIMTGDRMALNGHAWITDSLFLPGTPKTRLNGQSVIGSSVSGGGSATPSGYTLTLNGQAAIGTLVTQSDPEILNPVAAPPDSTGRRDVTINKPGQSIGDPATLRDLTVNGDVGIVTLPAGTYRDVTINGKNVLVLTGGTYNFRELKLNGADEVRVEGAVVITVAKGVKFNGTFNPSEDPSLVVLNIADGDFTLNGKGKFYGFVNVPGGEVTLNGLDLLKGGLIADKLTINGQGVVELCDAP